MKKFVLVLCCVLEHLLLVIEIACDFNINVTSRPLWCKYLFCLLSAIIGSSMLCCSIISQLKVVSFQFESGVHNNNAKWMQWSKQYNLLLGF